MASASSIFGALPQCSLIVGSAPESSELAELDLSRFTTVAVNNAWRVHPKIDYCIYPGDFPEDKHPPKNGPIKHVPSSEYYRHVYKAGGLLFSGATMAICAGYYAIGALRDPLISFWACNMDYAPAAADGKTHFYGQGRADPLLVQPATHASIKNLEAKAHRLFLWGLLNNKVVVNLRTSPNSKLTIPEYFSDLDIHKILEAKELAPILSQTMQLLNAERQFPVSRFSLNLTPISKSSKLMAIIDHIDAQWTEVGQNAQSVVRDLFA